MRILDVGQCHFDGPRMAAVWRRAIGAVVDRCDTAAEALERVGRNSYDLVLVNRVLDADGSSGLELIRELVALGISAPVMLVSNYPEAQDAAVALGAIRGFGKNALDDPKTAELVRRAATGRSKLS